MPPLRLTVVRSFLALVFTVAVAACGSSGASAAPGATTAAPGATTAAPASSVAGPTSTIASSVTTIGGIPDCAGTLGRKTYKIGTLEAQRYCGPATAEVTFAGSTATMTNGWCETNAAGFTVSIGTQVFGNPDPAIEPDVLVILVKPTTGEGTIGGVVNHKHWLLISSPVVLATGNSGGTFTGPGVTGGTVTGSFACN